MELHITGDGRGFEIRLKVAWRPLRAFFRMALIVIGAAAVFLSAPAVARLVQLLGG